MTADDPAAARMAALALLGLPDGASKAQVVDAYRRLARATHPDATGRTDLEAGQGFAELHDAYQLLSQARPEEGQGRRQGARSPTPPGAGERTGESVRGARPLPRPTWGHRFPRHAAIIAGPVIVTDPPGEHRSNRRSHEH